MAFDARAYKPLIMSCLTGDGTMGALQARNMVSANSARLFREMFMVLLQKLAYCFCGVMGRQCNARLDQDEARPYLCLKHTLHTVGKYFVLNFAQI